MKKMKKIFAILMAMILVMGMGSTFTFAANGTGTITIKNATKNINYNAYKIFDATYASTSNGAAVSYRIYKDAAYLNALQGNGSPFTVGTLLDGDDYYTVTLNGSSTGADIASWIETNIKPAESITAVTGGSYDDTNDTYKWSNVEYGYYYITSGLGGTVTVDTNTPDVTLEDKNIKKPENGTYTKVITAENGTSITAASATNDAAVGSTQDYKISFLGLNWIPVDSSDTSTSATNDEKVYQYVVTDTPVNQSIDIENNFAVSVGGANITRVNAFTTSGNVKEYKVEKSSEGVVTVTIKWTSDGTESGTFLYDPAANGDNKGFVPVEITYKAEILKEAAIANATNTFSVKHNAGNTDDGDNTGTPATTTTYKFALEKVEQGTLTKLANAVFEIYRGTVEDSNKVTFSKNDNTYTVVDSTVTDGTTTEITSSADALTIIQGLDNTQYTIREKTAPVGYNLAADSTYTPTRKNTETNPTTADVSVGDARGTELPSTGGIGTTIFYVLGSILVLGAGVVLIVRRRVSVK